MQTSYALRSTSAPTLCRLTAFAAARLAQLPRPGFSLLAAECAEAQA